jgi:hypothetical protein
MRGSGQVSARAERVPCGAQRMIHFSSVDAYSVVDFPDGIDERTAPSMT